MTTERCPLCGGRLSAHSPRCRACGLGARCELLCCSLCGYQTVAPRSLIVELCKRIFSRGSKRHGSSRVS